MTFRELVIKSMTHLLRTHGRHTDFEFPVLLNHAALLIFEKDLRGNDVDDVRTGYVLFKKQGFISETCKDPRPSFGAYIKHYVGGENTYIRDLRYSVDYVIDEKDNDYVIIDGERFFIYGIYK